MELAPVVKQDMLVEGQFTLHMQQTQLTVNHSKGVYDKILLQGQHVSVCQTCDCDQP